MYRIAVCDDNESDAAYVAGLIEKWAAGHTLAAHIEKFPSAEAFLFRYEEDRTFDMLFLDIEMHEMSGMELAARIRKSNHAVQIVFVTGYMEYIAEGYDVEALHYLLKPLDQAKFGRVLDRYADRRGSGKDGIVADTENGSMHICVSEIMYLEAFGHSSRLYMRDGQTIDCRAGIGELRARLAEEEFVSCHRSYIVNLRYVRTIGRTELTLDDGRTTPVSRRSYREVCKAFAEYYTAKKGGFE